MALASVSAQTLEEWECIVVDDGSIDRPAEIVDAFGDRRIRFIRHERNMGRAAARQTALKHASGQFVAFVDADDWIYPEKLERQVATMQKYPQVSVVSCPLSVLDVHGDLCGIAGQSDALKIDEPQRMSRLGRPPFPFVSAMIRRSDLAGLEYRRDLLRAEDLELFVRLTLGRMYLVQPDPLYAYSGWADFNLTTYSDSLAHERMIFLGHRHADLSRSLLLAGTATVKSAVYRIAHMVGVDGAITRRRLRPANGAQIASFKNAHSRVQTLVRNTFLSAVPQ